MSWIIIKQYLFQTDAWERLKNYGGGQIQPHKRFAK